MKRTGKTCTSDHLCLSLLPLTSKFKFSDRSFHKSIGFVEAIIYSTLFTFTYLFLLLIHELTTVSEGSLYELVHVRLFTLKAEHISDCLPYQFPFMHVMFFLYMMTLYTSYYWPTFLLQHMRTSHRCMWCRCWHKRNRGLSL